MRLRALPRPTRRFASAAIARPPLLGVFDETTSGARAPNRAQKPRAYRRQESHCRVNAQIKLRPRSTIGNNFANKKCALVIRRIKCLLTASATCAGRGGIAVKPHRNSGGEIVIVRRTKRVDPVLRFRILAARPADAPVVNLLHGVVPHIHRVGATVSLSGRHHLSRSSARARVCGGMR